MSFLFDLFIKKQNKQNMEIIKKILGFTIQCVGMAICLPCLLIITIGEWIVDLGETLRMVGD